MELGIPVTVIANTMQLAAVMEGKHTIDIGMLVLPVLVELIMLVGDSAKIEYNSGLEKDKKIRTSLVDNAIEKVGSVEEEEDKLSEEKSGNVIDKMKTAAEERVGGLMSRSA
jgi:hypothetical protein